MAAAETEMVAEVAATKEKGNNLKICQFENVLRYAGHFLLAEMLPRDNTNSTSETGIEIKALRTLQFNI